ncbi:TIGR01777 family oxidoreductase [Ornithinibacillus halophilus]|uniref:TIGR01777 family protein n=1 Tax=Ornithinibacillus halophilus TaxID=930117 RepID=A0A1M5MND9_9BACI|nr:TIGR01777 family oxidoreductase [Ornithinibacillus halophilus]SHG78756.1 hypothetical protein SAMN05216225_10627 [Ornithinibacillus halophilus]
MNFLITGGTGFVGRNLVHALHRKGHHTYILTRSPEKFEQESASTFIGYDYPVDQLPKIYGVINLAGESLFGYWTNQKKKKILSSRIDTTNHVIKMIKEMKQKPDVFISGSAVGFYGMSDERIFSEDTETPGDDFLADVVVKWEDAAKQAEELGIRTVFTRFGVILGREGALPLMSMPVKMFVGGKVGKGEQWMSWVHIEDAVQILVFSAFNKKISGPINVTSPNPKRNKDFIKVLAKALKRPNWLPAPAPMFRMATGQMSQLITSGQYVLPKKAENHGYEFEYPNLEDALKQIFG